MLYLFDEYCKELVNIYGKNALFYKTYVKKFADCSKNLHEMTIDEINNETSNWELSESTQKSARTQIKRYLNWLSDKKNIDIDANIADKIVFSMRVKKDKVIIYSSDDLHDLWQKLFGGLERFASLKGKTYEKESHLSSYAASILVFYGLNQKQIFDLTLSDIQENKVADYNLPLTERDNDILMQYKRLTYFSNGKALTGYRYFRFSNKAEDSEKSTIDAINRNLQNARLQITDDVKYLTKYLTLKSVFEFGLFNRIYCGERNHTERVDRKLMPQWAQDILMDSFDNGKIKAWVLDTRRKDYLEYRKERMEKERIEKERIEKERMEMDAINSRLASGLCAHKDFFIQTDNLVELIDKVDSALNNLDTIRNELLHIKQQIAETKQNIDAAMEQNNIN